ncbi:hypothetical protein D3C78_1769180 [compost metagenome]
MGRQQVDGIAFAERTLVVDIKGAQAVDLIVEEIDAVRFFAAHGEQVEQRAAGGELTVLHHLIDAAVAGLFQLGAQFVA